MDQRRRLSAKAEKATQATAELHDEIRHARADGLSLREIALLTGLSHQTISNICKSRSR